MLAKEDIQTNLLDFQSKQGLVNPAQAAQGKQTTVASQYHINIAGKCVATSFAMMR